MTLAQLLALPELQEMRQEIQRLTRRAGVKGRLTDDWYYRTHTGGPPPATEAVLLADMLAQYQDRINELCRQNGLPDYLVSVGPP